ncbi:hypothetical protein K435DRAFT_876734 [Dendrothele bispora CBS 962.96]|uniref:Uncharacterized protein n=1 Tax=Dendrothele bispora (strain CBS 962.96) TaxID=1314807 RepID=A0A4S8KSH6_DENBC|nr:hypothetical protein K435DRAFT_876734 [Dendrothele bispora CBS 962.96]
MINAEVIPDEHQSTTTRTVLQTLPSSALCYNGIRVIPCTRPPVNPLPKKLHFPPLRINHNANAIANVPQPSRIEVSSPPTTSRQKSTSTSPTLPPTVFQTPPPRQVILTSPPTPPPHHTVKPTRHVRYRPTPVHHIHPHPYAHAYHHQRTTTRPQQQQQLSPLSPMSTNNFAPHGQGQSYALSTNPSPSPSPGSGSPLQSLFDHTSIRILRDISHLQTSCYAVLHNERREKEVMRVKMMRMKRERDLAFERLGVVKGLGSRQQLPVDVVAQNNRQSLKRHWSDGDVDDMMVSMTMAAGLPTPPLTSDINEPPTSTHGASALEIDSMGVGVDDSSDLDLDKYTLSYPYPNFYSYFSQHSPHNNTNTSSSSSPPPPPISGRRLFFDTCTSSHLNPTPASHPHVHTHDLCSPIHLDSKTYSAKAKKRGPRPLTTNVLSRDPDNHEEYSRQRRGVKRRRIDIVVESGSTSTFEMEMEGSMSPGPVPFGLSSAQSSSGSESDNLKSNNGSGSGSGEDTLVNVHSDLERRRTHTRSPSSKEEEVPVSITPRILSPPHLTTTTAALLATTPPGGCDSAAGRPLSGYSSDLDSGSDPGCSGLGERDMDLESESESDAESVEVPLALTLSSSYSMTKLDGDRSGRQRTASEKKEDENVNVTRETPSTSTTSWSKSPLQSVSSISISRTLASTSTSTPTPTLASASSAPSSGTTQTPKTPSPSPSPKETSSSILKSLPKLDLKDLGQMFVQEGDRIHCRLCPRSESRSPPNSITAPSSSFTPTPANTPNLDAMIQHCTHSHPKAYSDVSGLSLDQVYMLRSVLSERSTSASASASLSLSSGKRPKEV